MNPLRRRVASALALLALTPRSDTAAASPYAPVLPGSRLVLPRDHGAHPGHRIEWWYITGWLEPSSAQPLGFQITFFRVRQPAHDDNPSRFAPRQLLLAHAALSDPRHGRLRHAQRSARAGFGLAEAAREDMAVHIGDWSLRRAPDSGRMEAAIAAADFSLDLHFEPTQPVLLQGDDGFSRKGPDATHASHYLSWPQLAVRGRIGHAGRQREVGGSAWLDHEWSSALMPDGAHGWDWLGINLGDGGALMAFRMRDESGAALWAAASLRTGGSDRRFRPEELRFSVLRRWRSPRTGADYPVELSVAVGERLFTLRPLMDDQELDSQASTGAIYWEGAVTAYENDVLAGRGYLELTGYARRLRI
ncbi:lipocalin-like domain-containing protein [Methyloversatilis thermotolerans]|uniref:lipocalin-like domain-containing protein n=1 Tax=Methyloversatilis thermotolerans TaxID=1346290 RepID=UPI0003769074|nr:carotenoid 1,2-hydratase [Methyloversatilis thermotolerans]